MTPSTAALSCAAALLLPLVPGPAPAAPDTLPRADSSSGSSAAQHTADDRGKKALAALHYPWRDLGYEVVFRPYTGSQLGVTDRRTHRVTVYVKDGQTDQSLRMTLGHELGHALDFDHGDADRHAQYRRIRGLAQSGAWYPGDGRTDYDSDAGDWAEVFSYALAGAGDFRSRRGPAPTAKQLQQLKPLFRVPASPSPSPSPSPSASPSPSPSPSPSGLPLLS